MAGKVVCAECGKLTVPGRFCEKCGKPLAQAAPVAASSAPAGGTPAMDPEASLIFSCPEEPDPVAEPESVSKMETGLSFAAAPWKPDNRLEPEKAVAVQAAGSGYCEDMRLEYNAAQFFVDGVNSPFALRLLFLCDGITQVTVAVEADAGAKWSKVKRLMIQPVKGVEFTHRINYRPENLCGVVSFDVRVSYCKAGEMQTFEASTEHKVYPADSSAREVMDNIIVNIHNEISADRAGDAAVYNNLDQLRDLKDRTAADAKARNLIDQINDLPPAFCALDLYPSVWQAPEHSVHVPLPAEAPPEAKCDRLTLVADGRYYQLIAGDDWAFGRERRNEMVLRHIGGNREDNLRISRFHCRIELHGEHCYVKDGGFDPEKGVTRESSAGTFVNGQRLAARGSVELKTDAVNTVGLAGAGLQDPGALVLEAEPVRCRDDHLLCRMASSCTAGMISTVFVRRLDEVAESYVLLVRCTDMGRLRPEWRGLRIWRQDGGFMYSFRGRADWLAPGRKVVSDRLETECVSFRQWGITPLAGGGNQKEAG